MRQNTNRDRVERLMRELGTSVTSEGRVYFTGGVSAVLLGWRDMTLDVDLKADPEPAGFFESLPRLKNELDINIELAAPDQFVPPLPGWRERSRFIAQHGKVVFLHYDFYSQALAKLERGHARDRHDVGMMLESGLVEPGRLLALYLEVENQMMRYPAVDAEALHERVQAVAREGKWI
ncbi:hypothetical protein [Brevifollis gellanilyticus]|uniref:Nucleotidyltransferase n=1 Tax=Brevifollis gellanilyticus TaxID=748831 RepID=A0A512MDT5_9BACT|nr:hypothetical protein [Brevifollis gellanilyticus]GEP44900.1 hypothetical protein BGE01nite_41910 [Brevifollis gellanilyticus]